MSPTDLYSTACATNTGTTLTATWQNTGTSTYVYNDDPQPGYRVQRFAVPAGQNYVDIVYPKTNTTPRRLPAPLEFNRYLNASDLLEEFIAWLGTEGVRQGEVMDLPLDLFVKWVIVRACEQDDEEPNVALDVPRRPQPRCLGCQRFMPRRARVPLHGPRCAERHFARALSPV